MIKNILCTGFHGPLCHFGHSTFLLHSCVVSFFGPTLSRQIESSIIVGIPPATICSHLILLVCSPSSPHCLLHELHSPSIHSGGHASSLHAWVLSGSSCGSQRFSSTDSLSRRLTQFTRRDL